MKIMTSFSLSSLYCVLAAVFVCNFLCVSVTAATQKVFVCNTFPGPSSQVLLSLGPSSSSVISTPLISYESCVWWTIDDTWTYGNMSVYYNNNYTVPYSFSLLPTGLSFCSNSNYNVWYIDEQTTTPLINLNNPIKSCTAVDTTMYRLSFYNTYVGNHPFVDLWTAEGTGSTLAFNTNFQRIGQDLFSSIDIPLTTPLTSIVAYIYNTTTVFNTSTSVNIANGIVGGTNIVAVLSGDANNNAVLWVQYSIAPGSAIKSSGMNLLPHMEGWRIMGLAMTATSIYSYLFFSC